MAIPERFKEGAPREGRIKASTAIFDERDISLPGGIWRATPGRFDLTQGDDQVRATASFLAYRRLTPNFNDSLYSKPRPLIVVVNGGPSSPATLFNAQLFSGPYRIQLHVGGGLPNSGDVILNHGLLEHADILNIDPPHTGLGRVLDKENPHWANGVQRDGEILAACTESFRSRFADPDLGTQELAIVGSSYRGAVGMSAFVLDLLKRGIKPAALGIISGLYDAKDKVYDTTVRSRPDLYDEYSGVRSFVQAMAPMALANWHHNNLHWKNNKFPEELYEEVRKFATGPYVQALQSSGDHSEIIARMSEYIGLSPELIREHGLRINPDLFRESLLPGKILSAIDTRRAFPYRSDIRIDPYLDLFEVQALDAHLSHSDSRLRGYPRQFRDGFTKYKSIVQVSPWQYDGLWANRDAYEAMTLVLKACPEIRIVDFKGLYDLNNPGSSLEFWNNMQDRIGGLRVAHHYRNEVFDTRSPAPGVDIYTLHMGHQPDDGESNMQVVRLLSALADETRGSKKQ